VEETTHLGVEIQEELKENRDKINHSIELVSKFSLLSVTCNHNHITIRLMNSKISLTTLA
jgi:hypothetical protein